MPAAIRDEKLLTLTIGARVDTERLANRASCGHCLSNTMMPIGVLPDAKYAIERGLQCVPASARYHECHVLTDGLASAS